MRWPEVRDAAFFNAFSRGHFSDSVGIEIIAVDAQAKTVTAELLIQPRHIAPNGYLHGGAVVTLADTTAAYACIAQLPADAGFTTAEMKANLIGTLRDGAITCVAQPLHIGRTTHVWDATVHAGDAAQNAAAPGRVIAAFRCTQVVLQPRK